MAPTVVLDSSVSSSVDGVEVVDSPADASSKAAGATGAVSSGADGGDSGAATCVDSTATGPALSSGMKVDSSVFESRLASACSDDCSEGDSASSPLSV